MARRAHIPCHCFAAPHRAHSQWLPAFAQRRRESGTATYLLARWKCDHPPRLPASCRRHREMRRERLSHCRRPVLMPSPAGGTDLTLQMPRELHQHTLAELSICSVRAMCCRRHTLPSWEIRRPEAQFSHAAIEAPKRSTSSTFSFVRSSRICATFTHGGRRLRTASRRATPALRLAPSCCLRARSSFRTSSLTGPRRP